MFLFSDFFLYGYSLMKKLLIILLILIAAGYLLPDTSIDDLEKKLDTATGEEKIRILDELAQAYWGVSPDKSIEYGAQALDISEKASDLKNQATAQLNIGVAYIYLGKFDPALNHLQHSLRINRQIGDTAGIAQSLNRIGVVHGNLSQYNDAMDYFLQSLKLNEELGDKDAMSKSLNNIGIIYQKLGTFDKALEYFTAALKIVKETGKKNAHAVALNNIGTVYKSLTNFDLALDYYLKSLKIRKEIGNKKGIAITSNNIGLIYKEKGQYQTALEYLQNSLKIREEIQDNPGISESTNNIGNVYEKLDQNEKALDYYLRALRLKKELKDKWSIAYTFKDIGNLYLKMEKSTLAFPYIEQGLKLAEEIQSKELIMECFLLLSDYFSARGNSRKALEYFKLYTKKRDIVYSTMGRQRITDIQTKSELGKKQAEIEILERDKEILKKNAEIQRLDLSRQQNIQNSLIVLSVLVLVIVLVIYNRYRFKAKAHETLEQAHHEISAKNDELTIAYKKMDLLARTDPLTGLSNRRDILEKIQNEIIRFERNRKPFALIMGDIDNFKAVNDRYGHDCGDFVLMSLANEIRSMLRKQDIIGRWGGEEFLIFLPETDLDGGQLISEKIREKITDAIYCEEDGPPISITMTFGVAVYDRPMHIDQCIKLADLAMYKGKKRSKNSVTAARYEWLDSPQPE